MKKAVSIAQAKNELPALVHEAERHPIAIERRGKRVAVLLSAEAYDRLAAPQGDLWSALQAFRDAHDLAALDIGGAFDDTRDRSHGRGFGW